MPKSLSYEGLIPATDAGPGVLKHLGLQDNHVARARVSQRLVRAALDRQPELAVWIGGRLYILDEPRVLDALADELGVLKPPVAVSPSSMDATV